VRVAWEDVPIDVRSAIEERSGTRVVEAVNRFMSGLDLGGVSRDALDAAICTIARLRKRTGWD
jgi:hypothetical protein